MTIRLPPPQVLDIRGSDAAAFAHAQFSSDVRALESGRWQWSAWLSAQGRVRALFQLLRIEADALRLVLRGGSADELRRQLSPYVLRAKVRIETAAPAAAFGCFEESSVRALLGEVPSAGRHVASGSYTAVAIGSPARWLVIDAGNALPADDAAPDRWRAADIAAGIAELAPNQLDRFVPAALGLQRLGAISVGKGCYPGQEIVARLHFKGGNKRWLHRLEFTAAGLPEPGLELLAAGADAPGELLQAAWTDAPHGVALAVLPESAGGSEVAASTSVANFRVVSAILDASD